MKSSSCFMTNYEKNIRMLTNINKENLWIYINGIKFSVLKFTKLLSTINICLYCNIFFLTIHMTIWYFEKKEYFLVISNYLYFLSMTLFWHIGHKWHWQFYSYGILINKINIFCIFTLCCYFKMHIWTWFACFTGCF